MRFLFLIIAAIIVIFAGSSVVQRFTKHAPYSSSPAADNAVSDKNSVEVLAARQYIPLGAIIEDSMLEKQSWPTGKIPQGFIVNGSPEAGSLSGRVARSGFVAHEPLNLSRLGNPGDANFMAAVLPQGSRAITITLPPAAAMAGYIYPGDHVDVLLTRGGKNAHGASEKLAEGLLVLGVNPDPADKASATGASALTLEVPDNVAQKLRSSETQGIISLALRPAKDPGTK